MERENRKRLSIDMPIPLHNELRLMAMKYQCTITKYLLKIVVEKLKKERAYDGKQ